MSRKANIQEPAAITPLEQIAVLADFSGFTPEDFALFETEGFAPRMALIRERIKPKLIQVGALLAPRLSEALGETVYPHVAQHLRRTVNAPVETWVAFAREKRAYKPFIHLRVAISAEKLRVTAFCEDYADDKALYAANLAANAEALAPYFLHHPTIRSYDLLDDNAQPTFGSALSADVLRQFAGRLGRVKGQHAVFGIAFHRDHPVLQKGPELLDAIVEAAVRLKPLYDSGKTEGFRYTYAPEPIPGL